MKKPLLLSFILVGILSTLHGQTLVRGSVEDTSSHSPVPNASIVCLRAKDSILRAYCVTAADGSFSLPGIDTGRSILLITYPGYADYTDFIDVGEKALDLGRLSLTNKVTILHEVVVRGVIPSIRFKGDTTEYTADSFHVQPNATAEELLKQLPGVQVDKDGKITAQGQTVKKVLVDGEEFFGDDPTAATRNLRADMIGKVQVYDKKSDQAAFTRIDDGVRDKTVNLQLKKNMQKGWFGKVDFGGGSDGYYENEAMVNLFRGKERISAYGIAANTGRVGLPWQDNNDYAGTSDQSATKDVDLDAWDGNYNGQGIPTARTGGLHYNDAWNNDKISLNANYKVSDLDVSGNSSSILQNNLPNEIYYSNSVQAFRNQALKNKLQTSLMVKLDPSSTLKIDFSGLLGHKTTNSQYTSMTRQADSSLLNKGDRQVTDNGQKNTYDGNILWEKKLNKKGRTFSLDLHSDYGTNHVLGYLYSDDSFYFNNGVVDSARLVDQHKNNNGSVLQLDGKAVYTEPLSSGVSLLLDYEVNAGRSSSTIRSYNKSTDGMYDSLDFLYSNAYHFNRIRHEAGPAISITSGKWRAYAGDNIGFTSFKQDNVGEQPAFSRSFINWYPGASVDYQFSLQRQLGLSYEGNTIQPQVDQLQPILNNYDPLNIFVGNQRLNPVFTNLISIHYNDYHPVTQQYLFSNFSYSFSGNQITTNTMTDSTGVTTYQYVNSKDFGKYTGYVGFGGRIPRWESNWGFNLSLNGTRSENLTNGLINKLTSTSSGLEGYIGRGKKDVFDLDLRVRATYNTNRSSLQQQAAENYWVYVVSPGGDLYLPGRLKIHSDVNYTITQKTPAFTENINVFLWNAWIGKYFLKKNALMVKLAANDLLNQNKGVIRNIANNLITQNTYSTVRQFFLFSVVWNFTSMSRAVTGAPAKNQ